MVVLNRGHVSQNNINKNSSQAHYQSLSHTLCDKQALKDKNNDRNDNVCHSIYDQLG